MRRSGFRVKDRERVGPHEKLESGILIKDSRSFWPETDFMRFAKVHAHGTNEGLNIVTIGAMGQVMVETFRNHEVNSRRARRLTRRRGWKKPWETKVLEWSPDK